MIKPKKLNKGDMVAIVSLSSGTAGDKLFKHRYEQGKKRIEEVFGLKVITMPNAWSGLYLLTALLNSLSNASWIFRLIVNVILIPSVGLT